jgi:hypothetical protein
MGIEAAIIEVILHAPEFVEGVKRLMGLSTGQPESSDSLTIDEVTELVSQAVLAEVGNLLDEREKQMISKFQSLFDKGVARLETLTQGLKPAPSPIQKEEDQRVEPIGKVLVTRRRDPSRR